MTTEEATQRSGPSAAEKIENLDTQVFAVKTQCTPRDRHSLLQLQNVVRAHMPGYGYLEAGSYLGGSLLPHLLDPACRAAFSVDPRPATTTDERGSVAYPGNSTARMLGTLRTAATPLEMMKLRTFEVDLSELKHSEVDSPIHLALIDAEHTNRAVFRDFTIALELAETDAIIACHDANVLIDGICNIECHLKATGVEYRSFYLPDLVFAVALGAMIEPAERALRRSSHDGEDYYRFAKSEARAELEATLRASEAKAESIKAEAKRHRASLATARSQHAALTAACEDLRRIASAAHESETFLQHQMQTLQQSPEVRIARALASLTPKAIRSTLRGGISLARRLARNLPRS